jgi:dolichol-phosphate mannosyltransferase
MTAMKETARVQTSIIVPAYKEVDNLTPLVERVFKALDANGGKGKDTTEMIIVDDNSGDGSEEAVKKLAKDGYPVRIIVRKTERGLSSAVLRGFLEAKGDILICMDADLQHPPESVPDMIQEMAKPKGKDIPEFAIGTRYADGETMEVENWAWYRQIISKGARLLARPLTPLSDPMTGFFAIKRDVLLNYIDTINPVGFKIALELFVKCHVQHHAEIPIEFGMRLSGSSKLTGKVILYYLKHLRDLYYFRYPVTKYAFPIGVAMIFWAASWILMQILLFLNTLS